MNRVKILILVMLLHIIYIVLPTTVGDQSCSSDYLLWSQEQGVSGDPATRPYYDYQLPPSDCDLDRCAVSWVNCGLFYCDDYDGYGIVWCFGGGTGFCFGTGSGNCYHVCAGFGCSGIGCDCSVGLCYCIRS